MNYESQKVTLSSAFKSMFKKYFDFSGRSGRKEYWFAVFANAIIIAVAAIIFVVAMENSNNLMETAAPFLSVLFVYLLSVVVPALSLTVRRLHDIGKSGWFILLGIIPGANLIVFIFTLFDSQPGNNKYGPNPKGF